MQKRNRGKGNKKLQQLQKRTTKVLLPKLQQKEQQGKKQGTQNILLGRRNSRSGDKRKVGQINWKRQTLIFNPEEFQSKSVSIIGLGNIGSQTALGLARLGITMFELFDHDKVESHNLSSQSFTTNDLGEYKVISSKNQIKAINPSAVVLENSKKYEGKYGLLGDVIVIAVDSMKIRKEICKNMKRNEIPFPSLLIDGRMGGPQLEVHSFHSYEEWENSFCDNPSNDPCGARFICYTSMVIGAFISNQIKRFLKNEPIKKEIIFNINNYQLLME